MKVGNGRHLSPVEDALHDTLIQLLRLAIDAPLCISLKQVMGFRGLTRPLLVMRFRDLVSVEDPQRCLPGIIEKLRLGVSLPSLGPPVGEQLERIGSTINPAGSAMLSAIQASTQLHGGSRIGAPEISLPFGYGCCSRSAHKQRNRATYLCFHMPLVRSLHP